MKVNYQAELDKILEVLQREHRVPRLLLHFVRTSVPSAVYVGGFIKKFLTGMEVQNPGMTLFFHYKLFKWFLQTVCKLF